METLRWRRGVGGTNGRTNGWREIGKSRKEKKKEKECGCDAWINEQKLGCRRA